MGVIKKNDTKVGMFNSPSEESLHIPGQSSEDERSITSHDDIGSFIPNQGIGPQQLGIRHRLPVPTYFHNARKRLGKKKSRHHENVTQLMTLVEDDEELEKVVTIYDLVPDSCKGGLSQIFTDVSAYQAWDEFINGTDEIQGQILESNNIRRIYKDKLVQSATEEMTGEQAFMNITSGIRNKLKRTSVPQGMIDYLENNLVDFFTQDSTRTYISDSISSFERLLLHAISQYHRLISQSVDTEPDKIRLVHVYNPYDDIFKQPAVLLGQYLEATRKNGIL